MNRRGVAWIPDKPGKQTVQLLVTPTFVNSSSESNLAGVINQSFELPIVPAGNATLELEADPTLQVDIDSFGGTTNPALGGIWCHWGNVSKCKVEFDSRPPAEPRPHLQSESVTMSTEYLMQQSILRAKTVIKVPKEAPLRRRFEMEADSPWQR